MKKTNLIVLAFYSLLFVVLAIFTLTTAYVEGDDASTILYHLMGRNVEIQSFYSPYHSGFDFLLSFLPMNESVLINTAVITSFIFGFLTLYLSYYWVSNYYIKKTKTALYLGLLLPFIVPEFLFQSLLYNPTNVAFALSMISLIFIEKFFIDRKPYMYLIIPLIFLIAIPFRWSLLMFFTVPLGLYLMKQNSFNAIIKSYHFWILLLLSVVFSFIGIYISGFNFKDVLEIMLWGKGYNENTDRSVLTYVANGLSFFTPAFTILILIGFLKSFKANLKIIYLIVLSAFPFFILGFIPSLKFSITLLPVLLIMVSYALEWILEKRLLKIFIILIVFMPWIFSVQVKSKTYAYGPGFNAINWKNIQLTENEKGYNPDARFGGLKIMIKMFDGGFAMPTPEGPRPVYGYFNVLIAGQWKSFINDIENEKLVLLSKVESGSGILVQDRQTAFNQVYLYRLGYVANKSFVKQKDFFYREFKNDESIVKLYAPTDIYGVHFIDYVAEKFDTSVAISSSYSSLLVTDESNARFQRVGVFTAVLND